MHGFFSNHSWNELLKILKIKPEKINEQELQQIVQYCKDKIKSNLQLPAGNVETKLTYLKTIYDIYTRLVTASSLINEVGQPKTPILLNAAKLGFDRFLAQALSTINAESKQVILNLTDKDGNNALHIAAINGQAETIDILLRHGVENKLSPKGNKYPIQLALLTANPENRLVCFAILFPMMTQEQLLAKDNEGESVFLYLVRKGMYEQAIEVMAKQPLVYKETNNAGETAFHLAIQNKNANFFELFLNDLDFINAKTKKNETCLHYAANKGIESLVQELLKRSPELKDKVDEAQNTALHHAASRGHINVVQQLLAAGLDPFQRNMDGLSAIEFAKKNGHQACAAILEKNIDHKTSTHTTLSF